MGTKIWEVYREGMAKIQELELCRLGLTLFQRNGVYCPAPISLGACLNISVTRTTGINPEPGFLENKEICSSNQNNYSKKCCRV